MNTAYFKLRAKKQLVKNHFKCFLVSVLPYVAIVLLTVLNYYFYILLKGTSFEFLPPDSLYGHYFKPSLLTLSIILSFLTCVTINLFSGCYFYYKSMDKNMTYFKAIKSLSIKKIVTAVSTVILKFFLSVAWSALYLAPSVAVSFALFYYLNTDGQIPNISLALFISAVILFCVGITSLFITLKRYSMCNAIIFSSKEKDSLKVIEKSIEMMEGKSFKYSLYCLSFTGWVISCLAIIPIFYVLPYKAMSKFSFYNGITKDAEIKIKNEKPIIFYFTKRVST